MGFIYVACPYTESSDGKSKAKSRDMIGRYEAVEKYTASLLKSREAAYSPIVHCHALAIKHDLPKDAEFWMWYNDSMLLQADELFVLGLDGWKDSVGVTHEIQLALENDIPVTYINLDNLYKDKIFDLTKEWATSST